MTDRAGLKLSGLFVTVVYSSVTVADRVVLKQKQLFVTVVYSSVTVADRAVLKPVGVDIPFDLGISISKNCKIYQVFLFLRPARSFFDQAIGSPQAYIPALTAVWIHYSRTILDMFFISHSTLAAFSLTVSKIDRLKS